MNDDLLRQVAEHRISRIEEHARLRKSRTFVAQAKRLQRLPGKPGTAYHVKRRVS